MLTFKILGSLEVVRDGESLSLGAAKQRALVACLLLHPNESVSTDRLVDELWGQEAPSNAEHNLHVYVSRLRKILEEDGRKVLLTRAPGYLLQLGADDVLDAALFEALLRQARGDARGDPAASLALLERGLALWRGAALADFVYEPFAQAAAGRLEELRVVAEEERVETLLALGRHQDAIPEIESLVQRYPLREHLRAQQMLALYRAGRQSEALAASQAARQALSAELGIDPGPELRSLEEAILRHDPDLRAPERPPSAAESVIAVEPERPGQVVHVPSERGPAARPAQRRRFLVPLIGFALLGVIVLIVALATSGTKPSGSTSPTGSPSQGPSVAALDLSWQEAGSDAFTGVGDQKILGAVETPAGYVVFGYSATPPTDGGRPDYDVVVWRGAPEVGWVAAPSDLFVGTGNQRATDGIALRDGTIVLVGSDQSRGNFDGAVWRLSSDGSTWSRANPGSQGLRKEQDQFTRDAATAGRGLVAVGSTEAAGGEDAAVWQSQQGRKWIFIQNAVRAERGDQEMATVARSTARLAAAGFSELDGDRDAAVWISTEGNFWRRVDPGAELGGEGDQQINALVSFGSGFIAVGEETIDDDTNAVVWTSTDGREWTRVPDPSGLFGGDGDQRMYTVAVSPLGIVAAGSEVLEPDWDAAVWTSLDRVTWERLPGDTPAMNALADIGDQEIKALVPTESGFLALGSERGEADWDAQAWIGEQIA